jgi:hypothetical protein
MELLLFVFRCFRAAAPKVKSPAAARKSYASQTACSS